MNLSMTQSMIDFVSIFWSNLRLNLYSIIVSFIHSFIKKSYDFQPRKKKNVKESMNVWPNVCKYLIWYKVMNSDVSYEVSYDGNYETKNDKRLNRNWELTAWKLHHQKKSILRRSSRFVYPSVLHHSERK